MKKIICLIGARSNPKNEEWTLLGKHLILWPYIASLHSKYLGQDNTWISTNSSVIPAVLAKYTGMEKGFNNLITRPNEYATNTATDLEWITHALAWLRNHTVNPDIIVHLRATSPTVEAEVIDEAIAKFLQIPEATSLRSAHGLNESPHKMFVKDGDYWKPFMAGTGEFYNQPRQNFATVYHPNGYVDILRAEVIESGSLHGNKIMAFETDPIIEIDKKKDLEQLEIILANKPKQTSV